MDNKNDSDNSLIEKKNYLGNISNNNDLKNLISLSNQAELNIFSKKNKKMELKSKSQILKECEQIKKKEIKMSSSMLSNLAKLSNSNDLTEIKSIYQNLENKISNIDRIINCVTHLDLNNHTSIKETESIKIKPNIVDFNEIGGSIKPEKNHKITIKSNKQNFTKEEIPIKISPQINITSSPNISSDDFIECYTNC
jgi:hypothetical protein